MFVDIAEKKWENCVRGFMKDEKVNEIINAYGKVLEEYAGYMAISEKRLSHSKKDIKRAIAVAIAAMIRAKQNTVHLVTAYTNLALFQKDEVSADGILGDARLLKDPKEYLKKTSKQKKTLTKVKDESLKLFAEIKRWEKKCK